MPDGESWSCLDFLRSWAACSRSGTVSRFCSLNNSIFNFGAFELNRRTGELRKHGVRLKLQDQPLQILTLLLERAGEMVTREEIQARLWPANTYVDFDNAINSAVRKLRDALGDSAENPRFVETLPRRGYRFIAPVWCEGENGSRLGTPALLPAGRGQFKQLTRVTKADTSADACVDSAYPFVCGAVSFGSALAHPEHHIYILASEHNFCFSRDVRKRSEPRLRLLLLFLGTDPDAQRQAK